MVDRREINPVNPETTKEAFRLAETRAKKSGVVTSNQNIISTTFVGNHTENGETFKVTIVLKASEVTISGYPAHSTIRIWQSRESHKYEVDGQLPENFGGFLGRLTPDSGAMHRIARETQPIGARPAR